MKKQNKKNLYTAISFLMAFILWTFAVKFIDVQAIGPQSSNVGFAVLNRLVHNLTGVHMSLYKITDWLGLVPIAFALGFALLGLMQWIKRKKLKKVDYSIFVLGGFYIVVMSVYMLFEIIVINYRPVLIEGFLEASYPSSTTMLVMCVMPTAIMQFNNRIKNKKLRRFIAGLITSFIVFMVAARLISGVHWFTDIVAGTILSTGLVVLYRFAVGLGKTK